MVTKQISDKTYHRRLIMSENKDSKGKGFGLGFGLILDSGNFDGVGSAGEYYWGGVAGTRFWVDPQEKLIGIFMVQSVPHRTRLADDFRVQTYRAMTASQAGE